jgi:NAD(P)H dehydrogenase (quinone)
MNKILVTGATGALGRLSIDELLKRTDASNVAALARDPSKVSDLSSLGVDVRRGDYDDPASLLASFAGVDTILLISAVAFGDRLTQQLNVIKAAVEAGVKHIAYTSIQRKADSAFEISMVTQVDIETEQALENSGLTYTILRNGLYIDVLPFLLGEDVLETGVCMTSGNGAAPMVSRADLAAANATVLTQTGHEGRVYTLGASEAFSYDDVAAALSELSGRPVTFNAQSADELTQRYVARGLPEPVAKFLTEWSVAVSSGEFSDVTGDLERLIGRKPLGYREFLLNMLSQQAVS